MVKKYLAFFLYALALLATGVIYVMILRNSTATRDFFATGGYYLIFLLSLLWSITLLRCWRHYKPDVRAFMKSNWPGIIFTIILTAVVFISVKPEFRILSDETNLLAVSKSLVYEKRTDNIITGKWYYDNFYPHIRDVEKRPLLFPFLVSTLHAVLGYRAENVFLLNAMVLLLLFALIYINIRKILGDIWAAATVLLVASQPIAVQCATSGGYELLSCLFVVICFICLRWFLKAPSGLPLLLLWLSLLMLASIRYEGAAAFAIVMSFLFVFRYLKLKIFSEAWPVYFATPILLLPMFCQRVLKSDPRVAFEAFGKPPFSIKYLVENNMIFLRSLVDFKFYIPFATIIDLAAVLSLFYFGYLLLRGRIIKEAYRKHLFVISAAYLAFSWILYTSYHTGDMTHPSMARYYVIFFVLASVVASLFAAQFQFFRKRPGNILVVSVALFLLYNPISVQDRFSRSQTLPREYRYVLDVLKKASAKSRNFLVITNRPGMYTVHDYGAVNFPFANTDNSIIMDFKYRLYSEIYVIQDINLTDYRPSSDTILSPKFKLEVVSELRTNAPYITRISRVVGIEEDASAVQMVK